MGKSEYEKFYEIINNKDFSLYDIYMYFMNKEKYEDSLEHQKIKKKSKENNR